MNKSLLAQMEQLVEKNFDGSLSESEAEKLQEILEQNPTAFELYLELVDLHVALGNQAQTGDLPIFLSDRQKQNKKTRQKRAHPIHRWQKQRKGRKSSRSTNSKVFQLSPVFAIAACLMIVIAVTLINNRQSGKMPSRIIASLLKATPNLIIVRGQKTVKVRPGMDLFSGDFIRVPSSGKAIVKYAGEETSIEMMAGTQAEFRDQNGGKKIRLHQGVINCRVAKQPIDKQMSIIGTHVKATVLGTIFQFRTKRAWDELIVTKGKVLLTRLSDSEVVIVRQNMFARANSDKPLLALPLSGRTDVIVKATPPPVIKSEVVPVKQAREIILLASEGKLNGTDWKIVKIGKKQSLVEFHDAMKKENHIGNLQRYKYKTLGFVEFRFFAEGGKPYYVWMRGRSVKSKIKTGQASDMVRLDAPTGKWLYGNWDSSTYHWAWAKPYGLPAPYFNGFGVYTSPGKFFWIGGPADPDAHDGNTNPWRMQLQFKKTGVQTLRLYGIEGPIQIDQIWLSMTQSKRPEAQVRK